MHWIQQMSRKIQRFYQKKRKLQTQALSKTFAKSKLRFSKSHGNYRLSLDLVAFTIISWKMNLIQQKSKKFISFTKSHRKCLGFNKSHRNYRLSFVFSKLSKSQRKCLGSSKSHGNYRLSFDMVAFSKLSKSHGKRHGFGKSNRKYRLSFDLCLC